MAMNLILSFAGAVPKTARGKTAAPAVIVAIDNNACRLVSRPLFFSSILLAMYILRSKVTRFRARLSTNWRRNPDGIGFFLFQLFCRGEGETELLVNRNILSVGLECPAGASDKPGSAGGKRASELLPVTAFPRKDKPPTKAI